MNYAFHNGLAKYECIRCFASIGAGLQSHVANLTSVSQIDTRDDPVRARVRQMQPEAHPDCTNP